MNRPIKRKENKGIIILLNGPSSSGKTSIQKALQKKADRLFLRIGIDSFFDALLPEPDISRLQEDKRLIDILPSLKKGDSYRVQLKVN